MSLLKYFLSLSINEDIILEAWHRCDFLKSANTVAQTQAAQTAGEFEVLGTINFNLNRNLTFLFNWNWLELNNATFVFLQLL